MDGIGARAYKKSSQSCYFFFAAFTGFFLAFAFAISCFASSSIDIYAYWSYHTHNIAYWRFCTSMISLTPRLPPRNTTQQNITKTPQTRGSFPSYNIPHLTHWWLHALTITIYVTIFKTLKEAKSPSYRSYFSPPFRLITRIPKSNMLLTQRPK